MSQTLNNVVNRMSAWAHYLSQDQGDEDAQKLAGDVIKLLDVVRTSNEFLMSITDTVILKNVSTQREQLIDALKAVAEHKVEIIRPESVGGIIL